MLIYEDLCRRGPAEQHVVVALFLELSVSWQVSTLSLDSSYATKMGILACMILTIRCVDTLLSQFW
jgi:hypothetical protein